ncbi:plant UBX domain-containing protein 8-like [Amaranthus tricolor]|uniref:plant UBX domain-containing protein 8-like n=1 Tax=Amaranthus tricolor TaxID=29722 RepID=UPI0025863A50|nr:plant UBX domain-containing protein 8-like [Amaranthus tricolor]
MATPNREAIDTFMGITDAPESVAIQKLLEYGGNLNEAVNAYFSEGDRNILQEAPITGTTPPNDLMDIDDPHVMEARDPIPLLSATRGMNPFSHLDSSFTESLLDSGSLFNTRTRLFGRAPFVSQPREVREIPIEVKDGGNNFAVSSGHGPRIEDVTDSVDTEGTEIRGTVILEDDDDVMPSSLGGNTDDVRPSAPQFDELPEYDNDIEEEMIQAAIEASKRDAELQNNQGLHDADPLQRPSQRDETAEQGQRVTNLKAGVSGAIANEPIEVEELGRLVEPNSRQGIGISESTHYTKEAGSSFIQEEVDELDELPLVRNRSRRRAPNMAHREVGESEISPIPNPPQPTVTGQSHLNGNEFPEEWGGISSEEHDEAVMLEAAMFGGIPERGYHAPYAPHQLRHPDADAIWRMPRPPSPGLVAQRAIRDQQDDEYLAALQADREKEMRAVEEEKAAREAALEEQRKKDEESQRKLEEEQELERQLAAKEESLPEEPSADHENVVTLLVRMPDGSRRGRRFLKSDKLQSLFDFIDVGKTVKPGTYRVVRPYPRQAFGNEESKLSFRELGLTSKQEALFLELV